MQSILPFRVFILKVLQSRRDPVSAQVLHSMIPVFKGEVYQALGWRLYDETLVGVPYSAVEHQKGKEFEIVSPNGTVYRSRNVWEFCRVHDLQQGNLNKVLLGKRKSHKGWHLPDNSL